MSTAEEAKQFKRSYFLGMMEAEAKRKKVVNPSSCLATVICWWDSLYAGILQQGKVKVLKVPLKLVRRWPHPPISTTREAYLCFSSTPLSGFFFSTPPPVRNDPGPLHD